MIKDNQELKELYDADVKEKTDADWSNKDLVAKIDENDIRRKKRVEEIIAEGGVRTAADYHHAALIFQHGDTTADYKRANELAKKGMELGNVRSKWLYAASMDRFLVSQDLPQKYGTQFQKNAKGDWEMCPVDSATTDEEQKLLNVPPKEEVLAKYKDKYK